MSRHNPERARIWRELIDAWKQSGQTINAFCRHRKLTRSNFDRWRRILAAESKESSPAQSPAFVPVREAPACATLGPPMVSNRSVTGVVGSGPNSRPRVAEHDGPVHEAVRRRVGRNRREARLLTANL